MHNKYTEHLAEGLKQGEITVHFNLPEHMDNNLNAVVCRSGSSDYWDSYRFGDFADILKQICSWREVTKRNLDRKEYISHYCLLLKSVFQDIGEETVYLHQIYNDLEEELYRVLCADECLGLKVVTDPGEITDQFKVICSTRDSLMVPNQYRIRFRVECTMGLLDMSVLHKIQKYCGHVYIHRLKRFYKLSCNWGKSPYAYHDGFFQGEEDNFIKDMFRDRNIDLKGRMKEVHEAAVPYAINNNYVRHKGNIKEGAFRTDVYGNVLVDGYVETNKHIYIVGNCLYVGQYDDCSKNIPSCLQRRIIQEQFPYQVVNLSLWGARGYDLYAKLTDRKWNPDDVVIMMYCGFIPENDYTIETDWDEVGSMISEENWYWDRPVHCNYHAYEIIADQIFDKIRKSLSVENTEPEFYVQSEMRKEITEYIKSLKVKMSCMKAVQKMQELPEIGNGGGARYEL